MTSQFEKSPKEKLEHALADPVSALQEARQRFRDSDTAYRKILYEELSVAFAAHKALLESPAKWRDCARLQDIDDEQLSDQPIFPDSLRLVVGFVFDGKQSSNRVFKYARALEELYHNGVDPSEVTRLLKVKGIDQFYQEATHSHPRRPPAVAAGDAEDLHIATSAASAPPKRVPKAKAQQTTSADNVGDDDGIYDDFSGESANNEIPSIVAVDPSRTLWLRIDPQRLAVVLRMEKGEGGRIDFECAGIDREGWHLFDVCSLQRRQRS